MTVDSGGDDHGGDDDDHGGVDGDHHERWW